jgi:hypothetical protein
MNKKDHILDFQGIKGQEQNAENADKTDNRRLCISVPLKIKKPGLQETGLSHSCRRIF